jgi:hypothetical protein
MADIPFEWHGQECLTTGLYYDTLQTWLGCDSIVTLDLLVTSYEFAHEYDTICETDTPYEWHDQELYLTGQYYDTIPGLTGIDTIAVLHLTVGETQYTYEYDTISMADIPFEWHGQECLTTGLYYDTLQTWLGCDSIVTLDLLVTNYEFTHVYDTICDTDTPYEWHDQELYLTGQYYDTIPGSEGIDTIAVLHLTVGEIQYGYEYDTVSMADIPYEWHGQECLASGLYYDTLQTWLGCDSIVTLDLLVTGFEFVHEYDTICDTDTPITWHDCLLDTTGLYYDTIPGSTGIDTITVLHLTVGETQYAYEFDTISIDDTPFLWHDYLCDTSGLYIDTLQTALGCDSIISLSLLVTVHEFVHEYDTICDSDAPYHWHDQDYSLTGQYYDTIPGPVGLDTIAVLHLTVGETQWHHEFDTISERLLPYEWHNQQCMMSNLYHDTLQTALGCDSIITLHLQVIDYTYAHEYDTVCESDLPVIWHGQLCDQTIPYYDTIISSTPFDTIAILHLTIEQPYYDTLTITACDFYQWHGNIYTHSDVYECSVPGPVCDSTFVLNLTIVEKYYDTLNIMACDDFEWNNNLYQYSGQYTDTLSSQHGCDSIVTLNLTVINPQLEILGYNNVYYSSDIWHGIYHYYVVDSTYSYLDSIEWQCTNPDWIVTPINNFHCMVIFKTMGTGTLTAHPTNLYGCDDLLSIDINATEFNDHTGEVPEVILYPNPSRGDVTVKAPHLIKVRVLSALGQLLKEIPLEHNDSTTITIESMSCGFYLVEVVTSNGIFMERLIISK